jgi:hypothetical protein
VVSDREAVRLVAQPLEQVLLGRVAVEHDGLVAPRQEHALLLARVEQQRAAAPPALGQRGERRALGLRQPRLLHRAHRHAELALAAVDDEQVGERIGVAPREPPLQDLGERAVVVLVGQRADAVVPVAVAIGLAVTEGDAAGHDAGAAGVAHVVALERLGRPRQAEARRERLQQRELVAALLDRHRERVPRVLGRQLDERAPRPAGRLGDQRHLLLVPLAEEGGQALGVGQLEGQEQLARDGPPSP